jgi:hypothetical protein
MLSSPYAPIVSDTYHATAMRTQSPHFIITIRLEFLGSEQSRLFRDPIPKRSIPGWGITMSILLFI